MKPGAKLAAFALVLAAAFGGGAAMGAVFAPGSSAPTQHDTERMDPNSPGMDPNMPGMNHSQSPAPTRAP